MTTFSDCLGIYPQLDVYHDLYDVIMHEHGRDDSEPAFYYHSDHLGSAAYLTNDAGQVTQTLNYLPYGEDWVDIQNFAETQYPRLGIYTFNGKEKDYESGYHYYGARYYWSEVLTGWLSVDPMMDKYPSISPYNYCMWSPVILVDPDGRDWYEYTNKSGEKEIAWTTCHSQKQMKEKGIDGEYLGITASANGTYYGLLGDIVKENTKEGRAVKTTDQAIINRAKANSFWTTKKVDFGKVFQFESGAFNSIVRSYKYAISGRVQIMLNGNDNEGRLNDQMQVATPGNPNELGGLYAGDNSVKCPRLNIDRGIYRKGPVAAISFHGAEKAEQRFNAMYSFLRKGTIVNHATKTSNGWKKTIY